MRKAKDVIGYNGDGRTWRSRLEPEQCYHNALQIADLLDLGYIEGFVKNLSGEWVQHAWNYNNNSGEEFDLTYQLFLPKLLQCERKIEVRGTLQQLKCEGYLLDPVFMTLVEQKKRLEKTK